MLAKPHRLRKFRDFSRVYKKGIRNRTDCFAICVYQRSPEAGQGPSPQEGEAAELNYTRIGIAVGYKVSKKAVVRNRVKRRIRAACQHFLPQLLPGRDVVITARSAAAQCDYPEFLQQLKQLFTNAEILHGH